MGLQHFADKEVEVDEVMTSHIPHLVSATTKYLEQRVDSRPCVRLCLLVSCWVWSCVEQRTATIRMV